MGCSGQQRKMEVLLFSGKAAALAVQRRCQHQTTTGERVRQMRDDDDAAAAVDDVGCFGWCCANNIHPHSPLLLPPQ